MAGNRWTKEETTVAFALYCQIPFGKIHSRNSKIIEVAERIGRTPSALAMKMLNLSSIDPKIRESGRAGLGNASALDQKIWDEFHDDWDSAFNKVEKYLSFDTKEDDEVVFDSETVTSQIAKVKQRRKQSFFRNTVLASYKSSCCISGLNCDKLLIASHIVPWSKDERNRLNPRNGLCLSVLYDKVFDLGFITITKSFEVIVSELLKKEATDKFSRSNLHSIHGKKIELPERFLPDEYFLEYHHNNVFKG
jgi:putative restriction endonuclease